MARETGTPTTAVDAQPASRLGPHIASRRVRIERHASHPVILGTALTPSIAITAAGVTGAAGRTRTESANERRDGKRRKPHDAGNGTG